MSEEAQKVYLPEGDQAIADPIEHIIIRRKSGGIKEGDLERAADKIVLEICGLEGLEIVDFKGPVAEYRMALSGRNSLKVKMEKWGYELALEGEEGSQAYTALKYGIGTVLQAYPAVKKEELDNQRVPE